MIKNLMANDLVCFSFYLFVLAHSTQNKCETLLVLLL